MSNQVTKSQLEAVIGRINKYMKAPIAPYIGNVAQVGNYHLSEQYGGYALHRITNDDGAIRNVLGCGHVSKRELFDLMLAYLDGLDDGAVIRS